MVTLLDKDVVIKLSDLLHNDGRLTFLVTENIQQFHGWQVKTADDESYIATVVQALPIPPLTDFYRTRELQYVIYLKGRINDKEIVEEIVKNNEKATVDGNKWFLSNFIVQDVGNAKDGFSLTREFRATFRLSIHVPLFVTNQDITLKIDDVMVDRAVLSGSFDKALVPNQEYGDNESDIATGEEYVITFPLSENEKVLDIFANVVSKKYNKEYQIKINMIVVEKTLDLVLSGGNFAFTNDTNTAVFNAIFTRALGRTTIKINNESINVIGFTPGINIIPIPISLNGRTGVRSESYTNSYAFQLENDGSNVINDIVAEFDTHTNKKFTVEWDFNGHTFTKDCVVQSGTVPTSENPGAIISVVLVGGAFYGS